PMTPRHEEHKPEDDQQPREREAEPPASAPLVAETAPQDEEPASPPPDEGPVHRPLIRATLPRPEGFQKDARPVPEFTVRQNTSRGGGFRDARGRGRGAGPGANGRRPATTRRWRTSFRRSNSASTGSTSSCTARHSRRAKSCPTHSCRRRATAFASRST